MSTLTPDPGARVNAAAEQRSRDRGKIASNVVAAVLSAIVTFAYAGSFGRLVFTGDLAGYVGHGILAALVSSVALLLMLAWCSSLPFTVGGPDSNPSAILAVTLASLVQPLSLEGASPGTFLATIMMFVFASAFGCGAVVWLLGSRRWGRYVRYIPHPVVGGFLAGTGFLLVSGAFKMLTGLPLGLRSLLSVTKVSPLGGVTALAVAVVLTVLTRRLRHYLVIPSVIVGAICAFHVARLLLGVDIDTARAEGLLLPPLQLDTWHNAMSLAWSDVRWDLIFSHGKDFAAMSVVVIVAALLNTSSLELATGRDADADQELRAIGLGNMVAGFFGGMVASSSFNRSMLHARAGATSRWAACLSAVLTLGVITAMPGVVGFMPLGVMAGLILFLGVALLLTWLVDSRRSLVAMDYVVVVSILGIVIAFGIVTGVICGIFIACVTFAVTLSRNPNIRHAFTAVNRRANVERTPGQLARLRAEGNALRGYSLQGVLFFGTAIKLLDEIRAALTNTKIVLLDFRLIHGADGSAIVVLKRIHALCRDCGVQLLLTGLTPRTASVLAAGGFDLKQSNVRRFADLDRGLEWAEEHILGQGEVPPSLTEVLDGALTRIGTRLLEEIGERRCFARGEKVLRQGEPSEEFMFVETGGVHVLLPLEAKDAGESKRLRTYGPGSIVGEMGFFSGEIRSADIVAETDTAVLVITRERFAAIQNLHPGLARDLTRHIINTLSQRVRAANDEIRLLL